MNDRAGPETVVASPRPPTVRPGYAFVLWIALPLFLLGLVATWLAVSDPLRAFNNGAPPVERLTFERRILDSTGIHLRVRAGGSEPITIAQVQVDDAYWTFVQDPPGDLARLATAWIHIPFPWTLGEAHAVRVVTKTGTTFDHEIPVAVRTPEAHSSQLVPQAVLGAFVGIVPVAIGLMFYPMLRGVGAQGMSFLLALTIGLLAFLFVDSLEDALELAGEAAVAFQGHVMVVLAAMVSFLLLWLIGRRRGAPTGLGLATAIALGIGLHNLGEGLAIGAAFTAGAAGLGTFLVLGFTLHNITEGIGIAAPLVRGSRRGSPPSSGWPCWQALRPFWACGSVASRTARTGRPSRWPSEPGPFFKSSSRLRSISGVWTTDGRPGRFLSACSAGSWQAFR
ncbi:metal transporter [Microvirga ossetica]|uniref:Metal transporter n=1 Tax=Microvirga ossetica TaxID=1882682 RepID=A0A1B2EMJ8_9HYPH|nr:metal transporter [Microvirga ossetica]